MNRMRAFWLVVVVVLAAAARCGAAEDAEADTALRPDLPDLNVVTISRLPRYPGYLLRYEPIPGSDGNPYPVNLSEDGNVLAPDEDDAVQRQPRPGDEVEFTALVANHGPRPTGAFEYTWYIDGIPVQRGEHPSLDGPSEVTEETDEVELGGETFRICRRRPGTSCELTLPWTWEDGDHEVGVALDPAGKIEEICERNNRWDDRVNACRFVIFIDRAMYNGMQRFENHWGSYNFEDWLKFHVDLIHAKLRQSIHPSTPAGCSERIRIDRLYVQADGEARDRIGAVKLRAGWDSHWDFSTYTPSARFAKRYDWGLPHEWGHQLGLIDIYCFDTEGGAGGNRVKDERGVPVLLNHFSGLRGMMRGHGDVNFSEHSAFALNHQRGRRRGYYGDYLFAVPERNWIRILDKNGDPVPDARVRAWQHDGRYLEGDPVFEGRTDADGRMDLPNRPAATLTTSSGYTLRPNPFGNIHVVGVNGVFLFQVDARDSRDYAWLAISAFNIAYFRGNTDESGYDVTTLLPGASDAPAPRNLACAADGDRGVRLAWDAPAGSAPAGYRVYQRVNFPPRWEPVGDDVPETEYLAAKSGRYAVAAVDAAGRESACTPEIRAVKLSTPTGVAIRPDGWRVIVGERMILPALQISDDEFAGIFGTFHQHLSGSRDVAIDPDGRICVVTASQDARAGHSLRVLDEDAFPIRSRVVGGEPGEGAGAFREPVAVAVDADGRVYVVDRGNGRVQVFPADATEPVAIWAPGDLDGATGIAIDAAGAAWVADTGHDRIRILEWKGNELAETRAIDGITAPGYLALLPDGQIAVSHPAQDRVTVYRVLGDRAEAVATTTEARGLGLSGPRKIAWDGERLVVVDTGNHRVVALD